MWAAAIPVASQLGVLEERELMAPPVLSQLLQGITRPVAVPRNTVTCGSQPLPWPFIALSLQGREAGNWRYELQDYNCETFFDLQVSSAERRSYALSSSLFSCTSYKRPNCSSILLSGVPVPGSSFHKLSVFSKWPPRLVQFMQ